MLYAEFVGPRSEPVRNLVEREPLWAVGMMFLLGAVTATILPLLVGYGVPELSPVMGAVSEEVAKFVAFFLGVVVLAAVARSRGWWEMSGLMDGIVYGTALVLGFATGEAFVRELAFGGTLGGAIDAGPFATLWTTALVGLADGLFGAIIGAGFGAVAGARPMAQEIGSPLAGLVGAILATMPSQPPPGGGRAHGTLRGRVCRGGAPLLLSEQASDAGTSPATHPARNHSACSATSARTAAPAFARCRQPGRSRPAAGRQLYAAEDRADTGGDKRGRHGCEDDDLRFG